MRNFAIAQIITENSTRKFNNLILILSEAVPRREREKKKNPTEAGSRSGGGGEGEGAVAGSRSGRRPSPWEETAAATAGESVSVSPPYVCVAPSGLLRWHDRTRG